jgi:hypothetical protein
MLREPHFGQRNRLSRRQRKRPAARPHQRPDVQLLAADAFAAGLRIRAVRSAVYAARGDAPAERISLDYGLDSHSGTNSEQTAGVKTSVALASLENRQ